MLSTLLYDPQSPATPLHRRLSQMRPILVTAMPKHTDAVLSALASLENHRETLLSAWVAMIWGDRSLEFPPDLLASGAATLGVVAVPAIGLVAQAKAVAPQQS